MLTRFALILVMCLFSLNTWAADCGRFRVVKGDVTYLSKGSKKFKKARINKKVCQGDRVKTAEKSRAKVVMADQNELNISPQTDLLIEVYSDNKKAVLNVLNGKVRSNVKQKYKDSQASHYRVKTKSAVAGVRGTQFMASFDSRTNQSQVVTFEGEVAVGEMQGGNFVAKVSVRAGQTSTARLGSDPTPARDLAPSELASLDQETDVSDGPRSLSSEGGLESNDDVDTDLDTDTDIDGNDTDLESDNERSPDSLDDGNSSSTEGDLGSDEGGASLENSPSMDGVDDSGSDRDPAMAENPDAFLPSAELDPVEMNTDNAYAEPPRVPAVNNPILNNLPDNQQINDTIINTNQRSTLNVVPRLPGQ